MKSINLVSEHMNAPNCGTTIVLLRQIVLQLQSIFIVNATALNLSEQPASKYNSLSAVTAIAHCTVSNMHSDKIASALVTGLIYGLSRRMSNLTLLRYEILVPL